MTLNPPLWIRRAVYVLTGLGTPVVAYLNAKGVIGSMEVTLWSAEVAVASGMAALNSATATITGTVTSDSGRRGRIRAKVAPENSPGQD